MLAHGEEAGEMSLPLVSVDRPLNHLQGRVADVASPYAALIDCLGPGMTVQFDW